MCKTDLLSELGSVSLASRRDFAGDAGLEQGGASEVVPETGEGVKLCDERTSGN